MWDRGNGARIRRGSGRDCSTINLQPSCQQEEFHASPDDHWLEELIGPSSPRKDAQAMTCGAGAADPIVIERDQARSMIDERGHRCGDQAG
jgi:hypothetical protein